MLPYDFHNHTPLDFQRLKRLYSFSSGSSNGKNEALKHPSNLANIFLIGSLVLFVVSISYSVNVSQTTTNTKAATPVKSTVDPGALPSNIAAVVINSPFKNIKKYPASYNGNAIPTSIYTQAEQKYSEVKNKSKVTQYIIDRVLKYYMYTDVLTENDILSDIPQGDPTFLTIESRVPVLEKQVKTNLVTTADFAYVFAWYNSPRLGKVRKKLGNSLEPKARALLENYQEKFSEPGADPKVIIADANKNTELAKLNENDRYLIIENYTNDNDFITDINLPPYSKNFNNELFNLEPKKVSDIYKIDNGPGKKVYFIVYPIKLEEKKYDSFKDIYSEKQSSITVQ